MIASLPMYDWPEVRTQTAALWSACRDGLRDVGLNAPDALTPLQDDLWQHWQSPDLVLSQTCGLPFAAKLARKVSLVGAPAYSLPDLPGGSYCSRIVVRADDPAVQIADLAAGRFAYNMRESQSGWAAFDAAFGDPGTTFSALVRTGAHRASICAVADGHADVAAIDAVSWALAERYEPAASKLKVIASTPPTPGLPFITSLRSEDELALMRLALQTAIDSLPKTTRNALLIRDLVRKREADYAPLARGWPA